MHGRYTTTSADVAAAADLTDTATLTVTTADATTLTPVTAGAAVSFLAQPALSVAAVQTPSFTRAAEDMTVTLTVINTGNVAISAYGVANVPAATSASCSTTAIAIGASATCTIHYLTTAADVAAGYSSGTWTVTATPAQGSAVTQTSNYIIPKQTISTWTLTTAPNTTTYANAGDVVTYTYTVTNSGNVGILGGTVVTDTIGSTITCFLGTIPAGGSAQCTGAYTVTPADVAAHRSLVNTATITGQNASGSAMPVVTAAAAEVMHAVPPGLALSVSASEFSTAPQVITYTYVVRNTGSAIMTGLTIADARVTNVSCPATSIAAFASVTCTATYTSTAADVATGSIQSSASASATAAGNTYSANATINVPLFLKPLMALSVFPAQTSFTAAGQQITYHIQVQNNGGVALTGLSVTDTKVTGIVCDSTTIAINSATNCSGTYTTTVADVVAAALTSTTTATASSVSGASAPAQATTTIAYSAQPAWTVSATASPATYCERGAVPGAECRRQQYRRPGDQRHHGRVFVDDRRHDAGHLLLSVDVPGDRRRHDLHGHLRDGVWRRASRRYRQDGDGRRHVEPGDAGAGDRAADDLDYPAEELDGDRLVHAGDLLGGGAVPDGDRCPHQHRQPSLYGDHVPDRRLLVSRRMPSPAAPA